MTNKDDWIWSVMTTKRLTHMQRVIAWHLYSVVNDEGFIPYSLTEMAKRVSIMLRRNVQRAIVVLKYAGYLDDVTGPRTRVIDLDKRFRLSERYRDMGQRKHDREEMRV